MTFLLTTMIGGYNKYGLFKDTCIFCGLNDTTHIAVGSCNCIVIGWCVMTRLMTNMINTVITECCKIGTLFLDIIFRKFSQFVKVK